MKPIKEIPLVYLKHDIRYSLALFVPADSKRVSRKEKHARKYLNGIEKTFDKTIRDKGLAKFPFKHVLQDMDINIDFLHPERSLLELKARFSKLDF